MAGESAKHSDDLFHSWDGVQCRIGQSLWPHSGGAEEFICQRRRYSRPLIDPQELGSQPADVYVEKYIDQWLLLPRCNLVVSHGGSGTVIGCSHAWNPDGFAPDECQAL
jgi:hypothetical protein